MAKTVKFIVHTAVGKFESAENHIVSDEKLARVKALLEAGKLDYFSVTNGERTFYLTREMANNCVIEIVERAHG